MKAPTRSLLVVVLAALSVWLAFRASAADARAARLLTSMERLRDDLGAAGIVRRVEDLWERVERLQGALDEHESSDRCGE